MSDLCLIVAIISIFLKIGNSSNHYEDNRNFFAYQPCNITIFEGEDVEFNCTPIQRSDELIATWVINGERYYWADLLATPTYRFNLQDNSLTIINIPRTFNGYSYQCLLSRYSSTVAYLTVLYYCCDTTSSSNSSQQITTLSYSSEPDVVISSITKVSSTVTATTAIPITNGEGKLVYYLTAASAGIIITTAAIIIIIVVTLRLMKRKSLRLSASDPEVEDIKMEKNEVYGQIHANQTLVSMSQNKSYEYTEVPMSKN